MAKSIQVSEKDQLRMKQALRRSGWNQDFVAQEIGVARQTVSRLLNGHPVSQETMQDLCKFLGIDSVGIEQRANTITLLNVSELRSQISPNIKQHCGKIRVLDMEYPIELGSIYTQVNVLERLTANLRYSEAELLQQVTDRKGETFDRLGLTNSQESRIPGLEAAERHRALMVFGKPGAGKTTFLKYLAMTCLSGQFLREHVPIFVNLKQFAEMPGQPNLIKYIVIQWRHCGIENADDLVFECLKSGYGLVLLDGLDEVRSEDHNRVTREIEELSDRFITTKVVVTCRIAAQEYVFDRFREVEVADFGDEEIREFVTHYFTARKDRRKIKQLIDRLETEESVRELASSPLLLTLLCLVFGEAGDLPSNRAELYKEGVDLLLKKWDGKRNIQRDLIYKNLSSQRKENLLGQLALATFTRGEYFFRQNVAEDHIADYIRNLPGAKEEFEALRLDSEKVLKAIEAQHGLLVERARGVYSFSHLTFHEYFAAREIADQQAWEVLSTHLTRKRWREVVLLTAGSLRDVDVLVMHLKRYTDHLLASDPSLQNFLANLYVKSKEMRADYKESSARALALDIALALNQDLALLQNLDISISATREFSVTLTSELNVSQGYNLAFGRDTALNLDLTKTLAMTLYFSINLAFAQSLSNFRTPDFTLVHTLTRTLSRTIDRADMVNEKELALKLEKLQSEIHPFTGNDLQERQKWWRKNGANWTHRLRAAMVEHRDIGHDWQFTTKQKQKLKQYYDANLLLVQCLNSDCYVSREVRQEIDDTLLLPIAEIERYKAKRSKT
ncbi:MAG: NACHT domain-containing NTPase [Cyanobacteria bacterium P01_C01_bin.89]